MFRPNISAKEDDEIYGQFCKHELIKFCLYLDNVESAYDVLLKLKNCDWDYPTFVYKLRMNILHNDLWINYYMQGLIEFWLTDMNFQLVVDIDKIIAYMTKYVTKSEIEISSNRNKMILKL